MINLDLDRAEYGLGIAEALLVNTSLKSLDVWAWGGDISAQGSQTITKAFTNMLLSNRVLKFLTFQGLDWTNPEIDFYLRLNRAGRHHLLQCLEEKSSWTNALVKHKDDTDVCFYFLSLNPNIITTTMVPSQSTLSERLSKDGKPINMSVNRTRENNLTCSLSPVLKKRKVVGSKS